MDKPDACAGALQLAESGYMWDDSRGLSQGPKSVRDTHAHPRRAPHESTPNGPHAPRPAVQRGVTAKPWRCSPKPWAGVIRPPPKLTSLG